MPSLTLAYVGDAIFEIYIRTYLVSSCKLRVNQLHKAAIGYVSAHSQSEFAKVIFDDLTEDEQGILRRGRNSKSATVAKNASVTEYRWATGFEALLGYLYLNGEYERLNFLINKVIQYRQEILNNDEKR